MGVLGSFLLGANDTDTRQHIPKLEPRLFLGRKHQTIARAITSLADGGKDYDIVSVADWLEAKALMEQAGGRIYLNSLLDSIVTTQALEYHLAIVREDATRRSLCQRAIRLAEAAGNEELDVNELQKQAEAVAHDLSLDSATESQFIHEFIDEILDNMDRVDRAGFRGLSTGFSGLNTLTRGLEPGYILLAGRPANGKTTFAINMALHQARIRQGLLDRPARVGFLSIEMDKDRLVRRFISHYLRNPWDLVPSGSTKEQWRKERRAAGREIAKLPIAINDTPGELSDVVAACYEMRYKKDVDVVYIDYIQRIRIAGKHNSREREVSMISNRFGDLWKELGIPIIVLSQLNRNLMNRDDRIPELSDLRDSGTLEQDADIVMMIWDPAQHKRTGSVQVSVPKNREGKNGVVYFDWDKAGHHFSEHIKIEEPEEPAISPA